MIYSTLEYEWLVIVCVTIGLLCLIVLFWVTEDHFNKDKLKDLLKQYLWNNLWAWDRMLNAMSGGSSKEFISTRIYNNKSKYLVVGWLYQILNWIDPYHCERAAKRDYDPNHNSDDLLNR